MSFTMKWTAEAVVGSAANRNWSAIVSLNIKDPETHKRVKELATLKGISQTAAVNLAVINELERESSARKPRLQPKKRSEILAEYSEQFAPLFKEGRSGNDLINDLYDDETGLPK